MSDDRDFEGRVEAAARAVWEHQHQHDTVYATRTWEGANKFTAGPYAEGVARTRNLIDYALAVAGVPKLLEEVDRLREQHKRTMEALFDMRPRNDATDR